MTTLTALVALGIISNTIFYCLTRLKLKKMADQSTIIEGLVTRINTDATNIKTMLNNVISNPENTISDASLADLNAAVNNLDALATLPAPVTTSEAAPETQP